MKKSKIGNVKSHFLDSGAFSLWTKAAVYYKEHKCGRWDYYNTDEFWAYADAYVKFVKKYRAGIDLYANIDVIPNPELTWRNQQYLESKGLTPVPVVHQGTDLNWLHRYMKKHSIIALGGLAKSVHANNTIPWLDKCFDIICDTPDRMPKVKIHGFGISSIKLWLRYPWWSVDSTSIHKKSGFGWILVPYYKKNKFVFDIPPLHVSVSDKSPFAKEAGKHLTTLSSIEQKLILKWLDHIKVPLGDEKEKGVVNDGTMRKIALYHYYEHMANSLPAWPYPFKHSAQDSLL